VTLAAVDEPCVQPERDVVEEETPAGAADVDPLLPSSEGGKGGERVVAVEADVAGEVVPRPVRDADERQVALERHLGDRRERAVAARDAKGLRWRLPRELARVVAAPEDPHVDSPRVRIARELLRCRPRVARARVHEQQGAHRAAG
jgi:hypothetical protein